MDNASPTASEVVGRVEAWLAVDGEPEPWVVETSGSTGTPKQVLLSRRAVRASAALSAARLGGSGRWILALPPSYVAGLNVIARSLLAGSAPVILGDRDFGEAVREAGPGAFLSVVPTQLARLLPSHPRELATLHTVLLGGGPIDPALRVRAADVGVNVVATYGSAETCGGCVYDGVPLDEVSVAIADDGRVRISGPTLADGYSDPALTAESFVDGWFLTSDAGRVEDGRLQVFGRIDDMVITGGVNVPAPAVAARLRQHPEVAEAEVLGVPDEEWGNRLVAFVTLAESGLSSRRIGAFLTPSPEFLSEIRDWVAAERPRSWAPRQVVVLPEIPLLPNGKIDRQRLKALVESGNPQLVAGEPGLGRRGGGIR
ncbi:AMP-binding protein [Nocardioides sp. Kera G14]|uniref:AMP-binding protein n=1 Tax=Nocardioides sp. Kera G14 TaxID=2884264 RepID=UPI001D12D536|nr:AMP-binding protein [Nocardioides sp. Kera G14]UDY23894.1 AMP-binding protein [Nocardioides sp. Kera G14]